MCEEVREKETIFAIQSSLSLSLEKCYFKTLLFIQQFIDSFSFACVGSMYATMPVYKRLCIVLYTNGISISNSFDTGVHLRLAEVFTPPYREYL